MPSLKDLIFKASALLFIATAGGCLVSDEPMLDARTGKAAPLADADYVGCPSDESEDECATFTVTRGADGLYTFQKDDEEPAKFRFRRVARGAYAAQSEEGGGYSYYYGKGDAQTFTLVLMQCDALPGALRARLIKRGDFETDDDDFDVCTVKTMAGLVAATKAYANGVDLADHAAIVMTRVEEAAAQ
ncbi:MAG: hypothetical protein R3C58_12240 [Parvularculaceae bacterium]